MIFKNIDTHFINIMKYSDGSCLPNFMNQCISAGSSEWIMFCFFNDDDPEISKNILNSFNEQSADSNVYFSAISNSHNLFPGTISTEELLKGYDVFISYLMIRRSLLITTGSFNEYLGKGCIFEYLFRASCYTEIINMEDSLFINADTNLLYSISTDKDKMKALAFSLCCSNFNANVHINTTVLLSYLLTRLKENGLIDIFMLEFNRFTQNSDLFNRYQRNTAPIFIISGDVTCMGVLNEFANELAHTLVQKGQAVITTDGQYTSYSGLEDIEGKTLKALVGFQAPVLFDKYFKSFDSPKLQFWFDDPVFFGDMFDDLDDSVYMLCQDGFHAEYLHDEFGIKNAYQMPPGGNSCSEPEYDNRNMDIVFIGTYVLPEEPAWDNDLSRKYYEYMILHPWLSYEQGVRDILISMGITLQHAEYITLLQSLAAVYQYICESFRSKIIDTITESGIQLHVYGDSWKTYKGTGTSNLIIHPQLHPREMINELRHAKLSLNIMSWHKAGMTERVINSMLAGAVCISDETAYLSKHLTDNEIVQYRPDNLEKLPDLIRELLENDNKRISIAEHAYRYASQNETWNSRVNKLLTLIK